MKSKHINYRGWIELIRNVRNGAFEMDWRWKDFDKFNKDMGDKPAKGWCLTRRDLSSGYYKENCYWAEMYKRSGRTKSGKYYADYRKRKASNDNGKGSELDQGFQHHRI